MKKMEVLHFGWVITYEWCLFTKFVNGRMQEGKGVSKGKHSDLRKKYKKI